MRLGDDRDLGLGESNMIGAQVGPFTIVRPLGEGGMGIVYLAEHAVLKTRRAVKILSPQLTQNAAAVRRFLRSAAPSPASAAPPPTAAPPPALGVDQL